ERIRRLAELLPVRGAVARDLELHRRGDLVVTGAELPAVRERQDAARPHLGREPGGDLVRRRAVLPDEDDLLASELRLVVELALVVRPLHARDLAVLEAEHRLEGRRLLGREGAVL